MRQGLAERARHFQKCLARSPRLCVLCEANPEMSGHCLIVIVAHGDLGEALVRAAEMIMGPQADLFAVSLWPEDSPAALEEKLLATLQQAGQRPALVLVDLLGGTPFNVVARHLPRGDIACVTGVNLPMLLDLLTARDEENSLTDLAARAVQSGRDGMRSVTTICR